MKKGKKSVRLGPRFQAEIPELISDQQTLEYRTKYKTEGVRTRLWPLHDTAEKQIGESSTGRRYEPACSCNSQGSIDCINAHVAQEKGRLMKGLGPAFWNMRMHETGQLISICWSEEEKKVLESAVISNPPNSRDSKCFVEEARKRLPYQTKYSILRYYYNVYLPKKISSRIKSGLSISDSEEEEEEEQETDEAAAGESANKKRRQRTK